MASVTFGVLIMLCLVVAASLSQISQGGLHELQGAAHESQEGAHESQVGARESQRDTYELESGVRESQGSTYKYKSDVHESQGNAQDSQKGTHESQTGVHESQGGTHESQEGLHISQGKPQETQGRVRRQASQVPADWVACDFTAPMKVSCHNCNTRVICKPVGGILKPCSPKKPFCNNGVCSAIPTAECA